ncbi:MAG: hypothetical protein JXM70_25430 [Pirellulales bacterium]|nr:hypothetical protein [Pirellulales bacterium]
MCGIKIYATLVLAAFLFTSNSDSLRGDEPAGKIEVAFDVSMVDWPTEPPAHVMNNPAKLKAWQEATWGEKGLETAMDTALAAGAKRVNFRVHAAGPYWPTKVPGAAASMVSETDAKSKGIPSLSHTWDRWNMVQAAARIAHGKGVKLMAWFDLTEGHGGSPTKWALNHPELCIVDRKGIRLDGPVGIANKKGVRLEKTRKDMSYNTLIREGFMTAKCERPDGTSIDPHLSIAYPQVVEYRIALIKELLSFGVDGILLVVCSSVGYESPVIESFMKEHGIDPRKIGEHDPRWIKHQARYFTDFVRKVNQVIRDEERKSGRKLEFIIEGQGGFPGPNQNMQPEAGLPHVWRWAFMPDYVDTETIAKEKLADGLSFWTLREAKNLSPQARANVKLFTRYRYSGDSFTQERFNTRIAEAQKQGFFCLILNESRTPLATMRWLYPGKPGPLFELNRKLSAMSK